MSNNSQQEYISVLKKRYRRASKRQKTIMLDEFCANTGKNRKYVIRALNSNKPYRKRPGREKTYSDLALKHLRRLWILMDQMCSKNMVAAFPYWLPFYDCSNLIKLELLSISRSTIDRALKPYRAKYRRKMRSGTKSGRYIKYLIPIKPFNFSVKEPGYVEADTVAHCGGFMAGEFVWSVTLTDIFSGWTENRAVHGKSGFKVINALKDIEKNLPFSVLSFSSDNGSEFLNFHLIRHYGVDKLKRGRPYRKNDNCYVEQKNFTHVRDLFGYERFDRQDLAPLMNDIYANEFSLLRNFFVPQLKLKHKIRHGSKTKRVYTEPKTPYQILIQSEYVSKETKEKLKTKFESLNPFYLRQVIQAKQKAFYKVLKPITDNKTGTDSL